MKLKVKDDNIMNDSTDKMDLSGLYPWIQSVGKDTLSTYNLEMTRGAEMGETMGLGSEVQSKYIILFIPHRNNSVQL